MSQTREIYHPGPDYWVQEGDDVHLMGSHCRSCGQNFFPPRDICPKCFAENNMSSLKLGSVGKLYSYSIVHVAPKRFLPPYALGYVDFPEKVRVLGQLTERDPSRLKVDMDVRTEIGKIGADEEGNTILSYKFKPL